MIISTRGIQSSSSAEIRWPSTSRGCHPSGVSRPASQAAGAGFSSTSVSAALRNLKRHSTYHYRIVATNSYGATPGLDHTLRTGR